MKDPYTPSLVLAWNRAACDSIYHCSVTAPRAARVLAMLHTAMYDAWTCFTEGDYVSTTTIGRLKRPKDEWTKENRETAFSYAAYEVLKELFGECENLFSSLLDKVDRVAEDEAPGCTTPQGIGILSARLVLEGRCGDGAYSEHDFDDYTNFKPANRRSLYPEKPDYVDKWQPKEGEEFRTAHWGLVRPFALEWGGQFRPRAPLPAYDGEGDGEHGYGAGSPGKDRPLSPRFIRQAEKLVQLQDGLTDKQKIMAEYWAGMHEDKVPDTVFLKNHTTTVAPAQWCRIARQFAMKNEFRNQYAIQLFFALGNALLDTSIAVWDARQHYEYCRPVSVIPWIPRPACEPDKDAEGDAEAAETKGKKWKPYLKTPPSPEYPSSYSAFSSATAEIIHCFCGNSDLEDAVIFPPGSSVIDNCKPEEEVTLSWRNLRAAAEEAGMSRLYGGMHFEQADRCGRDLGRQVAARVWDKVCRYLNGLPPG